MRAPSRMISWAGLMVLTGIASSARAEVRPCAVDEKAQTIRCRGVALPPPTVSTLSQARGMAERTARQNAQRNLREALKALPVAASLPNDAGGAPTRLEDAVRKAQVVDTHYFSDGGVAVELQLSIDMGVTGTTASTPSTSDTVPVSAPATKVPGASQH